MSISKRMVVVEHGETVYIKNTAGDNIGFPNFEEAYRCTEIDFTGKYYIGYEPDINLFIDSEDETVTPALIPYAPYEWLINNIATLQERSDDPTYGLSGQELIDKQAEVAAEVINQARIDEIFAAREASELKQATLQSAKNFVDGHMNNITDLDSAKVEIREIFKKIIIHIIQ